MAIKIDLLPGYVGLRRVRKAISWSAALLVGGTAGVLFLFYYKGQQQLDLVNANLANVEANAAAAEKAQKATQTANADAAPVATLVEFLTAAGRTGAERAALLELTSHYIYNGAVINSMDFSDGKTVHISATVKTPEDYKALLLTMREGSKTNKGLLFAEDARSNKVTASGVDGFPSSLNKFPNPPTPGERPIPIAFPIGVNIDGELLNPVVIPVEPGAAGAAPAEGAPAGVPGPPGPTTP